MAMIKDALLCDIGNSYFHFGCGSIFWREQPNKLTRKKSEFVIYYISVNARNEKKLLQSHESCVNIEEFIQLDTIYQGLGVDRKAACLAVESGIIVDAGSAITLDIVQHESHLGGYIMPGIEGYRRLFSSIDALKTGFNLDVALNALPQNTKDAISYGCLRSIILTIQDVSHQNRIPIYFTGGDGKFLSRFFDNAIYDETLVFKGMQKALIAQNIITKG